MLADAKRVLVVEDDRPLSLIIRYCLEKQGLQVVLAGDGRDAWGLAEKDGFDAVVTDEQMPRMTGTELCKKLRCDSRYAQVPIVMVTGKSLEMDMQRTGEELGLAAIVTKPFSPKKLVAIVTDCLTDASVSS